MKLLTIITLVGACFSSIPISLPSYLPFATLDLSLTSRQVFLPLSIIIGLFGIDDDFLPFEKTPLSFTIAVLCFGAIVVGVTTAALKLSWHRHLLARFRRRDSCLASGGSSGLSPRRLGPSGDEDLEMSFLPSARSTSSSRGMYSDDVGMSHSSHE